MAKTKMANTAGEQLYSKKLTIISGILACVVLIAAAGLFIFIKESNEVVVATVGNEKITLKDYNERLYVNTKQGSLDKPTGEIDQIKASVLQQMVDMVMIQKELKADKISIPQSEIVTAAKAKYSDYDSSDSRLKTAYENDVKLDVARTKLSDKVVTWKKGYYLACRFDRYLQDDLVGKQVAADTLLKTQKPYALEYCNKAKIRLADQSSTFEKELAKLQSDLTIGNKSWEPFTMTLGSTFDKDTFADNFILGTDLQTKVANLSLKAGEISDPIEVSGLKSGDGSEKVPVLYAVVGIENTGNQGVTTDFDKWLSDKEKSIGVKTYVERIK